MPVNADQAGPLPQLGIAADCEPFGLLLRRIVVGANEVDALPKPPVGAKHVGSIAVRLPHRTTHLVASCVDKHQWAMLVPTAPRRSHPRGVRLRVIFVRAAALKR